MTGQKRDIVLVVTARNGVLAVIVPDLSSPAPLMNRRHHWKVPDRSSPSPPRSVSDCSAPRHRVVLGATFHKWPHPTVELSVVDSPPNRQSFPAAPMMLSAPPKPEMCRRRGADQRISDRRHPVPKYPDLAPIMTSSSVNRRIDTLVMVSVPRRQPYPDRSLATSLVVICSLTSTGKVHDITRTCRHRRVVAAAAGSRVGTAATDRVIPVPPMVSSPVPPSSVSSPASPKIEFVVGAAVDGIIAADAAQRVIAVAAQQNLGRPVGPGGAGDRIVRPRRRRGSAPRVRIAEIKRSDRVVAQPAGDGRVRLKGGLENPERC